MKEWKILNNAYGIRMCLEDKIKLIKNKNNMKDTKVIY